MKAKNLTIILGIYLSITSIIVPKLANNSNKPMPIIPQNNKKFNSFNIKPPL